MGARLFCQGVPLNQASRLAFRIPASYRRQSLSSRHQPTVEVGDGQPKKIPSPAMPGYMTTRDCAAAAAAAAGSTDEGSRPLIDFFQSGARLTSAAHLAWAEILEKGDTVVDATCGNGHDTAFLAKTIGPTGAVFGFDIQDAAVASTTRRLDSLIPAEERPRIHLVHGCHSDMLSHVPSGTAKLVCFNLGYLPSADKSVITQSGTTIAAIEAALEAVKPGGLVSIMCYTGHEGGMEEYMGVANLLAGLSPASWTTMENRLLNRPTAPLLHLAWRRPDAPPSQ